MPVLKMSPLISIWSRKQPIRSAHRPSKESDLGDRLSIFGDNQSVGVELFQERRTLFFEISYIYGIHHKPFVPMYKCIIRNSTNLSNQELSPTLICDRQRRVLNWGRFENRGGPVIAMKVLFVCNANVSRSQVAEALYAKLSGYPAESAGTRADEVLARTGVPSRMLKETPSRAMALHEGGRR